MSQLILDILDTYVSKVIQFILACAAVYGVYLAQQGLKTWRDQLHGESQFNLSRKVLQATFKLRDALSEARNPFISPTEMINAAKELNQELDPVDIVQRAAKGSEAAYTVRWNNVVDAHNAWRESLSEAEVFWGTPLINKISSNFPKSIFDIMRAIQIHLNPDRWPQKPNRNETEHQKEKRLEHLDKYDDLLYDMSDGDNIDDYKRRLNDAVNQIESVSRIHMPTIKPY